MSNLHAEPVIHEHGYSAPSQIRSRPLLCILNYLICKRWRDVLWGHLFEVSWIFCLLLTPYTESVTDFPRQCHSFDRITALESYFQVGMRSYMGLELIVAVSNKSIDFLCRVDL